MPGFDSVGALNEIAAMLGGIVNEVHVGVPESYDSKVTAVVTLAGQDLAQFSTGNVFQRTARYFIGFCYAVEGAETDAENQVADYVDALIRAVVGLRTSMTQTGLATNVTLDLGMGDTPDYQAQLGVEVRVYPVIIAVVQMEQIG